MYVCARACIQTLAFCRLDDTVKFNEVSALGLGTTVLNTVLGSEAATGKYAGKLIINEVLDLPV